MSRICPVLILIIHLYCKFIIFHFIDEPRNENRNCCSSDDQSYLHPYHNLINNNKIPPPPKSNYAIHHILLFFYCLIQNISTYVMCHILNLLIVLNRVLNLPALPSLPFSWHSPLLCIFTASCGPFLVTFS